MLDTRGDTAIYLIFAYARLSSILRKAKDERGIDVDAIVAQGKVVLEHQVRREEADSYRDKSDGARAVYGGSIGPTSNCHMKLCVALTLNSGLCGGGRRSVTWRSS